MDDRYPWPADVALRVARLAFEEASVPSGDRAAQTALLCTVLMDEAARGFAVSGQSERAADAVSIARLCEALSRAAGLNYALASG